MCVNERETRGTVRLKGVKMLKVHEYLGSIAQRNGECVNMQIVGVRKEDERKVSDGGG